MSIWTGTKWLLVAAATIVQLLISNTGWAQKVNITENIPYVDIQIKGKSFRIQRIQDTNNKLTNSFSKTSRPCPPFCIHPISVAPGVQTVGEIELIQFLQEKVGKGQGVLVDARIQAFFEKGTIPGSVNIPFTLLSKGDSAYMQRILAILGATKSGNTWDFNRARELMLFCNGPWCDQSPRAIRGLLSVGFPTGKLYYYRGGMQNWQALGLTTVKP